MKQALCFLACISVIAAFNIESPAGRDVARIEPIQIVSLTSDDTHIILQTDTGARGSGISFSEALQDMYRTTPAYAFLDTAEYLLIEKDLEYLIPTLWETLRPACSLCWVEEHPDLEQAAAFLKIHKPQTALKDYLAGEKELPTLKTEGERMQLVS